MRGFLANRGWLYLRYLEKMCLEKTNNEIWEITVWSFFFVSSSRFTSNYMQPPLGYDRPLHSNDIKPYSIS